MSSISINLNRTTGYTRATNFDVSINYQYPNDLIKIKWNFGDGAVKYDVKSATHYYITPGQYDINLYAYTNTEVLTAKKTVKVTTYIKDSVYFETVPPPVFAGHINRYPFKVKITTASLSENVLELYAQNSRSYDYQDPENKWTFLRPQWRFLDLDGNVIKQIKTHDSPLKINADGAIDNINGTTVGVSGFAEFYFVDDIYNMDLAAEGENYTTLWATLQTSARRVVSDGVNVDLTLPGHSNSLARAFTPYVVTKRDPDKLFITENGVDAHSNPRWTGAIQPIVIKAGFSEEYEEDDWLDGNGTLIYKPFAKYFPFEDNPIQIYAGVINLSTNFVPSPSFKWIDETGYKVGGYYKGHFYVDKSTPYAFSSTITAIAYIEKPSTYTNYISPYIWLSNPNAGTVSVAQFYKTINTDIGDQSNSSMSNAQIKTFDMPIVDTVDFTINPMGLSGFHGINSIAALPAPAYHAWMCDSELNYLYRVSTIGTILCAVDLNKIVLNNNLGYTIPKIISPYQMALDGNKNIWITLHDTLSVIKLDSYGNFLFAVSPIHIKENIPTQIYDWFSQNCYYPMSNTDYDHRFIEPTGLDTDKDNNVWVSYSNYLSGFVMKYNSNGNLLYTFSSPVCTCPQELITDKDGNVWICNNGNVWGAFGSIQKRSSTGVLLSSYNGIRSPNYLTLDLSQNLWFSYGFNKIGYINTTSAQTLTYTISGKKLCQSTALYSDYPKSNLPFTQYPSKVPWFNENENVDETAIEGIACDNSNLLYIINSIENTVYVFDTVTRKEVGSFGVNPKGFLFYPKDQYKTTQMAYYNWLKSLRAIGDWTGSRWMNKYAQNYIPNFSTTTTSSKYISGESERLNFYDRSVFDAFKINENFDLAENIKNVAKMPILKNSDFLFDSFLGNIFGKYPFYQDDLAVTAYEKIANFTDNTVNLETCEIQKLYDISNMVNSETENLDLNYPPAIKRVMNLASINISKLIGTECNCGQSYNRHNDCAQIEICPFCKKEKKNNRGELLDTLTYKVTAGTPVVLKDKSLNNYRFIPTGYINNNSKYTLTDLASSLALPKNWEYFYEFYEYVQNWNGGIVENLIDWDSEQTTISRNLSTNDDWYKQEGLLDIFFNYQIYKGLGLIDD